MYIYYDNLLNDILINSRDDDVFYLFLQKQKYTIQAKFRNYTYFPRLSFNHDLVVQFGSACDVRFFFTHTCTVQNRKRCAGVENLTPASPRRGCVCLLLQYLLQCRRVPAARTHLRFFRFFARWASGSEHRYASTEKRQGCRAPRDARNGTCTGPARARPRPLVCEGALRKPHSICLDLGAACAPLCSRMAMTAREWR